MPERYHGHPRPLTKPQRGACVQLGFEQAVELMGHRVKRRISVVGAVLIRDGAVLAAQRSPSMSLPGKWEFPGGKIEPGESPHEALVREIREELLCGISAGGLVDTTTHEYEFGVVTLTTYHAAIVDGEPRLTEHAYLRWVPFTELQLLDWAPADIPAVNRIIRDHSA